ncbi:hypothetical protein ACQ86N_27495 [Puia sp. P3]|uniref:hypothetical protein n=1 Tax=Puia sp. P3 TaxID=3423952 RepID=UPI003D67BD35
MKRLVLPLLFFCFVGAYGQVGYIDPTIGNVGALLEPTRPTVSLPNQVIRMYPVRKDYMDNCISSFPLTMVSHRLGEAFSIKPYVGELPLTGDDAWKRRMPYDHDLEVTRPWYYSTWLENDNITVEFAPGRRRAYIDTPLGLPGGGLCC